MVPVQFRRMNGSTFFNGMPDSEKGSGIAQGAPDPLRRPDHGQRAHEPIVLVGPVRPPLATASVIPGPAQRRINCYTIRLLYPNHPAFKRTENGQ